MKRPDRAIVLLIGCCLMILGPDALRAQAAEAAPPMADQLPGGALAYLGWSDLVQAFGLEHVRPSAVRDFIRLIDENDDDARQVADVVALALLAGRAEGGAGLYSNDAGGGIGQLTLLVCVDPGESRDAFEAQIAAIAGAADSKRTLSLGGTTLRRVSAEGTVPLAAWGSTPAGHLLLVSSASPDSLGALLAKIGKAGTSLAATPALKSAIGPIAPPEGPGLALYADARALYEQLAKPALASAAHDAPWLARLMEALRVEGVQSIYAQMGAGADGSDYTFVRLDGARRGLLKLFDQAPLSQGDLQLLPAELYWGSVWNLDLLGLWNESQAVMESVNPDVLPQVEAGLSAARALVGFSIVDDLLPALGDTWALFDTPPHGGFYGSGTVLVAEANDAKRLHGILLRLAEILAPLLAQNKVQLSVAELADGAHTVHYAVIGGVPSPVAPAWTFVDGRFVFGLLPQTVAAAANEIDPATRGPRLIDDPRIHSLLTANPSPLSSFGSADAHYMMHAVYGLLTHGVAAMASMSPQQTGALAHLPHFSTYLKGPRHSVSMGRMTAEGMLYESRGASLNAGVAAGTALLISILLPSLARARHVAKRTVSMSNLRSIGVGLHIYAADNQDQFPDSLDVLVEKGMLPQQSLTSPLQADPLSAAYVYIPGVRLSRVKDAGRTVVAYEQIVTNEGTNVLFVDGHVEWMTYEAFRAALQATFDALGRGGEIPPNVAN